ncbi:hypothetical protein Hanom_Chr04g00374141 [Helianthus anomalus]
MGGQFESLNTANSIFFDDAVKSISNIKRSPNLCLTPSKSPCTTNSIAAKVCTSIKNCNTPKI